LPFATIAKNRATIAQSPKLANYETTRREFSWENARRQLSGLPGGALNIGYEAADRHVSAGRGSRTALRWLGKDGVLVMETMYWPDEIREGEFEELGANIEVRPEEVQMAATIIDNLTRPFDDSEFEDKTRHVIEELARKKIEGEEIVAPSSPEPTKVVDLLEALKASVEATKEKKAKAG